MPALSRETALRAPKRCFECLLVALLLALPLAGCWMAFPQTVVARRDDGTVETCRYPSQLVYPGSVVTKDCSIARQ